MNQALEYMNGTEKDETSYRTVQFFCYHNLQSDFGV